MLRIWVADTGTYSETFLSDLRYFLRVILEDTYVGLVHYGFVTLRRNYSHLILEHVCTNWKELADEIAPHISSALRDLSVIFDKFILSSNPKLVGADPAGIDGN